MTDFKSTHSFEKRRSEATRITARYPDRIPVIAEMARKSNLPALDKNKFLVPRDLTVGQFLFVLRKRIKLEPEKAMFLFVNNTLPPTPELLHRLYAQNKDEDGFLYITIQGENTFGTFKSCCKV